MKVTEKQAIVSSLQEYCTIKGSQNAAARSLKQVSSATISQMINRQWDLIADEMWRNLAAQIGHDARKWNVVRTSGFSRMTDVLSDAKYNSMVFAVIGDAGSGKSESVKAFTRSNNNVFHLTCSEYWNRKNFMTEMLGQLSIQSAGYTVSEMMTDIVIALKKRDTPLVVLDEADKLSDQVLYFFISLYNQLEDHCGIVMCATDYLQKRITKGVRNSRKGYKEIFSRIGRKFIPIPQVNDDEIAAVCEANGVKDEHTIGRIINDSEYDMRRVKRLVHASLKMDK